MTHNEAPATSSKSLKERYRNRLIAIIAANILVFAAFASLIVDLDGLQLVAKKGNDLWKALGSAALAGAAVSILNGLTPASMKFRLVFWRWTNPLPGSRAVEHLKRDPRIDRLAFERQFGSLPADPAAQNAAWYRIFRTVQGDPAVSQTHEDFLFARDYAALSALFILVFGCVALYAIPAGESRWIYLGCLAMQYVLVTCAARNYGTRLVTTTVAVAQRPA